MILRIAKSVDQRAELIVGGIIAVLILAGGFYALTLGDILRFLPDEQDYLTLAENLAHWGRYTLDGSIPTAYRPPGYPLFLAIFELLGANVVWLRLINFGVFGLGLYLCFRALIQEDSRLAGLIGVMLMATYPLNFYTASTFYPQVFAGVLLVAITWLVAKPGRELWVTGLAGLLFGFLILTVPLFILTLGVYFLWLVLYRQVKAGIVFLFAALIVVGAWTARNQIVFGSFVFVSTNSGENLLLGNSEKTTPNGGRTVDISRYETAASGLDEVDRDRYFRDQAFTYINEYPLESLRMFGLKALNYFNFRNELVTSDQRSVLKDSLMLLFYGPLLGIFLVRLLLLRWFKFTQLEILMVSVYLSSALFNALFFTRIRFRLPYDMLLILCVALFVSRMIQDWAKRVENQPFYPTSNRPHGRNNLYE